MSPQSTTNNAHIREERVMDGAGENGTSEEEKRVALINPYNISLIFP